MIRQSNEELGAMLRAALEPQFKLNPIALDRDVTGVALSGVLSPTGCALVVAYREAREEPNDNHHSMSDARCPGCALAVAHRPECPSAKRPKRRAEPDWYLRWCRHVDDTGSTHEAILLVAREAIAWSDSGVPAALAEALAERDTAREALVLEKARIDPLVAAMPAEIEQLREEVVRQTARAALAEHQFAVAVDDCANEQRGG